MAPGLPRPRSGDRTKERQLPERVRFGWNRFFRSPPSWLAQADHDGEAAAGEALLAENRKLAKNDLKEKNTLDWGRARYHISHSGELGVAELRGTDPGAESEGRKNLVKSVAYRLVCPERAFFP